MPDAGPLTILCTWLAEARQSEGAWSDAVVLATATSGGRPAVRSVMLRGLDEDGLVFFTDEASRKARELADNPLAAAAFVWPERRREARIEGPVTRLVEEEADAVFASRPAERRLPLWAWRQDEVLADAGELRTRLDRTRLELGTKEIARPPYWGGYRLHPEVVEFWEERPHGLHERTRHRRQGAGWIIEILAP